MAPPRRPAPGNPPASYAVDNGQAVFFRRVGEPEYAMWEACGSLQPEPGGMAFGKHVTTTRDLAKTWGQRLVEWGHEQSVGRIVEIRLDAKLAEQVDFVGSNTDGIGPCYFIRLEQIAEAQVREV